MGYQGYQGQGFTYQGNWISSSTYNAYDVVTGSDGSTYITDNNGVTGSATNPVTDSDNWYKFTSVGAQGFQGYQGNQGTQGNQGNQGYQGDQGFQGYQGSQGNDGYQGPQGDIGDPGIYEGSSAPGDHNILWLDTTATASPPNATELQGYPVSATAPTEGQVLVFTSGVWTPTTL